MGAVKRNLRILIVAPTPFFADRGCHVRILEEAREIQSRGHHVLLCTYHHGRDIQGIPIKRSLSIPWYSKLSAGPSLHKLYVDPLLLIAVIQAGRSFKPDLIHAHLHEGVVIGKLASVILRVPYVADLQGSLAGELVQHQFIKEGGWVYRMILMLEALIMKFPDGFMVSSTKRLPGLFRENVENAKPAMYLPDCVDTKKFSPDIPLEKKQGLKEMLQIPDQSKVVGYLGVLTEYQGVSVLLQAVVSVIEAFPQVRFLIMGYPNVEYYQEKAKRLGIQKNLIFTGRLPYEEASHYLSICDLAVSPKFHSTEANGKLLNYMAMGLPVIASDTMVNREILGEQGVFIEVGNSKALATAILRHLRNVDEARHCGKLLRKRVIKEYSWDMIGDRMVETYQKILDKPLISQKQEMTEK